MPDEFSGPGEGRETPQPLGAARWDWDAVRRILVVRLRSIGDTVLATPALHALRRFLPDAEIDVLLEDWVAPLLDGSPDVNHVFTVERGSTRARLRVARELRRKGYDVAYNLHGGTTATMLMRAAGAQRRVGFAAYQYQSLLTDAAPPSAELWGRNPTHSAEQQLALIGWTGVPVTDRPRSRLAVTDAARAGVREKLPDLSAPYAVIHPAAAFATKQWATENFARLAENLHERGLRVVALAAAAERAVVAALQTAARAPIMSATALFLPEVTALIAGARLFVGNDSGPAHVAAAVGTPLVAVFGSSNLAHWRPWTDAPHRIVRETLPCQPCAGYSCAKFDAPQCILRVPVTNVNDAVAEILGDAAAIEL
jgi:predicted lipopolysaccharide heptosyltransferase III